MPVVIMLLAFMWGVQGLQTVIDLTNYGIVPRTLTGLPGIIFAPFIHGNLNHLMSNTLPFLVLGLLIEAKGKDVFWKIAIASAIIGGLITWVLGSTSSHIGASGLVFAFFGFLVFNGFYSKSPIDFVVAALVAFFYYQLFFQLFVVQAGISWIGHAGGAVAGTIVAMYHNKETTPSRTAYKRTTRTTRTTRRT